MKKLKLLILLLVAVLAFAIVGCGSRNGVPSDFKVKVTYCFNGGSINEYSGLTELSLYYRKGSVVAEPGKSTAELPVPKRSGYSVGGWYYAEKDANGELVRDDNGNVKASSRMFDFTTDKAEEDTWLVVVWVGKIRVTFVNLYLNGMDTCYTATYESGKAFNRPPVATSWIDGENIKIAGYYWSFDEQTGEYSDPIEFGSLTFDDLNARLPEEPEMQGEYILLQVYVKLEQV